MAFLPPEPATAGHTLVIPRVHVRDLWSSVDPRLGVDLMGAVVRVGRAIESVVAPEGMNLITSSGEAAEQSVFHLHFHVVPRWKGDGFGPIWPSKPPMDEQRTDDLAEQLRKACRA